MSGAGSGRPTVPLSRFAVPAHDRWFEDYIPGTIYEFDGFEVEQEAVVRFAREFDPQPFHIDEQAATESVFGGLIASGWHTASLMMRVLVDEYISSVASLSSPGIDELRWLAPVRPGDTLRVRATVLEARRSRSKPDRGIVRSRFEALPPASQPVMSMQAINLFACKPSKDSARSRPQQPGDNQ